MDPPPVPAVAANQDTGGDDQEEGPQPKSRPKKRKSTASSSSKKKKAATSNDDPEDPEVVLESFLEGYRPIIKALPISLRPVSSRHGAHSYTLWLAIPLGFHSWPLKSILTPPNIFQGSVSEPPKEYTISFSQNNVAATKVERCSPC